LFVVASPAQAVSIGLTPVYPDLTTSGATLSYTYTKICQNTSGSSIGTCGGGGRTVDRWDLSYGRLTVTKDGTQSLNIDGTGVLPVSNTTGVNYSLTVILGFNATGTALSGILATDPYSGDAVFNSFMTAQGNTTNPAFQGVLIEGTPTSAIPWGYSGVFGYSGSDAAGTFEFMFNNVTGDMATYSGADLGGIIISTFNLSHTLLPAGVPVETWDSKGVNFWKNNFSASSATVDTFVPVPGAAWLFGSALACLGWLRQRAGRISA
jgi:hypothetical protein